MLAIVDNSNPEILDIDLSGFTVNYETMDEDINGETTITGCNNVNTSFPNFIDVSKKAGINIVET